MGSLVVLVTGGSGFLGQHIIKHLQLYGDSVKEIRVLDLIPYKRDLDFEESKPVKSFTGSITDSVVLNEACKGVDAVLHIASIIDSTMFPNTKRLQEVNVKGTETVLNACKQQNVSTLIYCSTIATLQGFGEVSAGTETTVPVPSDLMFSHYGSTKYTAQTMVLNAHGYQLDNVFGANFEEEMAFHFLANTGKGMKLGITDNVGKTLKTLAILPLTMYGELDNNLTPFLRSLRGKVFPRLGPMKAYTNFAYVGNVAMMFVNALESLQNNPELGGQYFFGADDTPAIPMTSFLEPYLESLNASISSWYIPYWLMYILISVVYIVLLVIRPIFKVNLSLTTGSLACSNTTFYVTYDKAKTLLAYKPLYNYETSIQNSIKFYSKEK